MAGPEEGRLGVAYRRCKHRVGRKELEITQCDFVQVPATVEYREASPVGVHVPQQAVASASAISLEGRGAAVA